MAKSKAQKQRDKAVREGKLDPQIKRGSWNGIKPVTKVKENKRKLPSYDYDRAYEQAS